MKRLLLILFLLPKMLSSCSSDSDEPKMLSTQSLAGSWNIKELIKTDGTRIPYINLCASEKDYVKFYDYPKIDYYYHAANCDATWQDGCDNYIILENNVMSSCSGMFDGKFSTFTPHKIQIDYDESFYYFYSNPQIYIKGIVLTR